MHMKKRTFKKVLTYAVPCALFSAMIAWFVISVNNAASSKEDRELSALKNTVENGITMCYAVEGVYPESVEYLSSNYGLIYDKSKYIIHYDIFASNIRPTVMILERRS